MKSKQNTTILRLKSTQSILNNTQTENLLSRPQHARIFCFILTSPSTLNKRAKPIYEAWAKECDGLRFITVIPTNLTSESNTTTSTDKRKELLLNNTLPLLQPEGWNKEIYAKLTNKVFATIIDIYKNYLNDYDFFLKADDDTFIFMDHLRMFLTQSSNPKTYYGYNLKTWVSGGAGYVLTRDCLKELAELLISEPFKCPRSGVEGSNCRYNFMS
jgi:glycoprotein-N-acetylgalactosamine 3-beta-galactosyltransferase